MHTTHATDWSLQGMIYLFTCIDSSRCAAIVNQAHKYACEQKVCCFFPSMGNVSRMGGYLVLATAMQVQPRNDEVILLASTMLLLGPGTDVPSRRIGAAVGVVS